MFNSIRWDGLSRRVGKVACDAMSVGRRDGGQTKQRARRRQARQIVGEYHRQQLGVLLEHVRESLERLDRGEIERYQRAARKLWAFCGSTGSDWERASGALEFMRENGETHDWWEAAGRRKR